MKFDRYRYLSPPRPETKIMPETLDSGIYRNWICQVKKNGTCSVIYVPPKGEPFAKTRHEKDPEHKVWAFSERSAGSFIGARTKGWSVYVAELMHSKGNGIRDTNYIHDVLVYDGEYLIGKTYEERHTLLLKAFRVTSKYHGIPGPVSHVEVDDNTWIARNFRCEPKTICEKGFSKLFGMLGKEDEGVVLKNPKGVLLTRNNDSWQIKSRRPHDNYGF
jgi:hypothetical protein